MFNRHALKVKSLVKRKHDLDLNIIADLTSHPFAEIDVGIQEIAKRVIKAKNSGSPIIMLMGGHVIRSGVQKYLIDLMRQNYLSCLAMNGACIIHDFEFALIGATTESVSYYIKRGEFGLWKETAQINDIIAQAYREDSNANMGQAVGKAISQGDFPHKNISLLAAAYQLNIPATVHVGIGYDIIHEHSNCDGAATGALSYNDFLKFASVIQGLEGGVVLNFGSAVMGPEVYLKALSMARNIAHQSGKQINDFSTLVCDLHKLSQDLTQEASKESAEYYFRPWKTMLVRTVADGGESFYVQGRHDKTIPALWSAINHLLR